MNSIRITLLSLVIAGSASAEEMLKFVSTDACKAYYAKSVTPVAGETPASYCANRIMNFVEACTATKISQYVTAQKLKAFSDLPDREQRTTKTKFSYECQVASQVEVASNQQKVSAATAQQRAAASSGGASAGQQKALEAKEMVNLAKAGLQIYGQAYGDPKKNLGEAAKNILGKSDKAEGVKAAAAPAAQTQESAGTAATSPAANKAVASPNAPTATAPAQAPVAPANGATQTTAVETTGTTAPNTGSADPKVAAADAQKAASETPTAVAETGKVDPTLKDPANKVGEAVQNANKTPDNFATSISKDADALATTLTSNMQKATKAAHELSVGLPQTNYIKTITMINTINAEVTKYTTTMKKICARSAEAAYYLCLESPVAAGAKTLMDAAGPVLAGISSAQQTCSSTSKVINTVGLALTVAKGACVASKLTCDLSCTKAVSDIGKIIVKANTELNTFINEDDIESFAGCQSLATPPAIAACEAENKAKHAAAIGISKSIGTLLALESNPATKGTSPAIVAGCAGYSKEVAVFGAQVLGAFAAKKNAKACEEKLTSSGSGTTVTTQQYCDQSENSSTQLCVCQKNPMAKDCPGAVITDSSATTNNNSSDKGLNIKGVGGNSAFAGGVGTNSKPNAAGNTSLSKDSVSGALNAAAGAATTDAGALGASGGGGASGGSGGGGTALGTPGSDTASGTKKEVEEKKKWSFGAFSSDAMGSLGFGGGSSASKAKSGALTTGDQAAIQRQIASEKYAAEVSTASGKSNWEKVRSMYLIKENSFIFGQ